jgi:hypothetical protein
MIQIGIALEGQAAGNVATLSAGWGLATYANRPWYMNLFGLVRQGNVGIRRYGVVAFGFFLTLQFVNMQIARAAMAQNTANSSAYGKNLRAGSSLTPAKVR